MSDELLFQHGGYRRLKGFGLARLVYDLTVRFCDHHLDRRSRTHDQMVQAARSGVQNIAEGSEAAATSKKTELKLTQVARASLEELRLDYEDFLRQRNLPFWEPSHPILLRFKQRRCGTLSAFQEWMREEKGRVGQPVSGTTLAANGILSLLNLTTYLLDRQVKQLAREFERQGGFTERLYQIRKEKKENTGRGGGEHGRTRTNTDRHGQGGGTDEGKRIK